MDAYPELLGLLDADPEILVSRDQHSVADRPVPRQRDHVRHDERVHAFLFADTVHESQANLDVVEMSERDVLRGRPGRGSVIPVDAQEAVA